MTWFLIAVAITLLLLDIWVSTEVLSHIALLLIAGVAASQVPTTIEWRVATFLLSYLMTLAVYYLLWKQLLRPFFNEFIAPTRHTAESEAIVGREGVVVVRGDRTMIRVNGILWPLASTSLRDGDRVVVESIHDGVVTAR